MRGYIPQWLSWLTSCAKPKAAHFQASFHVKYGWNIPASSWALFFC